MRSRRSAVAAVVIGLLLAVGAALSAASAGAEPAGPGSPSKPDDPASVSAKPGDFTTQDTSCEAGFICFWVDTDQRGAKGKLEGTNPAWGAFRQSTCQSGTWDNCASSIINNGRRCTARVWSDGDYRGAGLDILRGNGYINLTDHYISWPWTDWNDKISSNTWHSCV